MCKLAHYSFVENSSCCIVSAKINCTFAAFGARSRKKVLNIYSACFGPRHLCYHQGTARAQQRAEVLAKKVSKFQLMKNVNQFSKPEKDVRTIWKNSSQSTMDKTISNLYPENPSKDASKDLNEALWSRPEMYSCTESK